MKTCRSALVAASVLAQCTSLAAAHAFFQQSGSGSVDYNSSCVRMPPNNSPVTDVSSPNLACNVGGTKAAAGFCEATAGSKFSVEMHSQLNDRSCTNQAIGGNHFGPVLVYMSKVDDASTADGASASWFKVDEFGYDASSKTWGTDKLNANCGRREFTIPAKIPAGDYLVRAEAIALHSAGQKGGAQFYMSCFQVKVKSTGTGQVPAGVKIPGAYSAADPGVLIDIYGSGFKSYTIPGPAVVDQSFF
ncbi:glycosyl hydrolase family 61-domain-containing protein [Podospora didyma]|uniref:lytic cellulose monooxygenase (C4-dehydrogenating) n=1 Tax=Podospora didyma TaxID=330526 RepID=A0AAE0K399_9PEZI|nr:glycosyl hydrolase family 61-domain-containing protein [Podospora didyma]